MISVGITGQPGFIGTHLFNLLGLDKENIRLVPFKDEYFNAPEQLNQFVSDCDCIVHLAAMNRHHEPQLIFETNIGLVRQLINAMELTNSKPHVLFSSSTQEERDNLYGKSKLEGRKLLEEWASRNNARFTGLIIPNVFGPFGRPYYNSVVATFSHQLLHDEVPFIDVNGQMKLIYVQELVSEIKNLIVNPTDEIVTTVKIKHTSESYVTEILEQLAEYKKNYADQGIFPDLTNPFKRNLFNTFVCYQDIASHYPVKLKLNTDQRGSFVETVKLSSGGQVSFSTTKPGITRGNHFHTRKSERFAVIKGKALIQLRKIGTSEVLNFELSGDEPAYVDMPVWYTHNITNTGTDDLYTIFWISEFYNPEDPDTFFESV
ncbi:MAG: SDR family oxidoreductase [Bacteroidetes bacterium]|nr:SDR family oxidoreductase [Bacteroidota bacterium]